MRFSNGYELLKEAEILPEERFEASLIVNSKVYLAPWRSLWAANKLHLISIPESCSATVLKWEWEIDEISKVVLNSSISRVFCTSTGKRCPIPSSLYPDYVAPDIHCSQSKAGVFFMGWSNNKLRQHIFNSYSDKFSVTLRDSYSSDERNKEHRIEYIEGLAGAKFSLCPRGVGSGTRRFWESLKAGAVPILISDEFKLPPIWDWENTIIRVSEKKALLARDSLYHASNISEKNWKDRSEMCRAAHQFFSSAENISSYINNVTI